MRVEMVVIGVLLTGWARPAWAADCASPYTIDALLDDLVAVESALRAGDDAGAGDAAKTLQGGLGCLGEVLPRMIAGRSYRAVAAGLVTAGAVEEGTSWFRTASEIEQAFEYGLEDLPATHPVRDAYNDAKMSSSGEEVALEGKAFADGKAYLDGRTVDEPTARLDRPHVFQWEAGGVQSFVIEGNAFPSDLLAGAAVAVADVTDKPGKEPKAPKEKKDKPEKEKKDKPEKVAKDKPPKPDPKSSSTGTLVVDRERPWEKTPLMIGGAVVMGGAGAVYYVSLSKRRQFNDSNDLDEITDLQPTVNRLVIASAAVFAVGAGTMSWGVILDGSGHPLPAVRVRF